MHFILTAHILKLNENTAYSWDQKFWLQLASFSFCPALEPFSLMNQKQIKKF